MRGQAVFLLQECLQYLYFWESRFLADTIQILVIEAPFRFAIDIGNFGWAILSQI